jgi:aminoglycoside phosphotransferase
MTPAQLHACRTVDDWLGRQWARRAWTDDAPDACAGPASGGGTGPAPLRTDYEALPCPASDNPVFRFTFDAAEVADSAFPRQIYAKVYSDEHASRMHGRLVSLSSWLVLAGATLRVPPLLSIDPERRCLLQAAAQGQMLADLGSGAPLDTALLRVGRALAQLHAVPVDIWGAPRKRSRQQSGNSRATTELDSQIAALMRPHPELLALARPQLRGRIDTLLHTLHDRARTHRPGWQPVLLHRDLHARQIFVSTHAIDLIDWDLAGVGDPALDLANLLTHIEQRWPDGAASACAALLAGYGDAAVAALAERLPLYRAFFHLRRACKAQRLWSGTELIEQRLAQAEQGIAGVAFTPRSAP